MNVSPPSGAGASAPRVDIPRVYNAAQDLVRAQSRGRAGRQDRLHRRRRHLHVRGTRTSASTAAPTRCADSGSRRSSACSCACSTPSTSRPCSSARSRRASCRSRPTRCSPPATTSTCCATAVRARSSSRWSCCRRSRPLFGKLPHLAHVIVSGGDPGPHVALAALMAAADATATAADTTRDDAALLAVLVGLDRRAEGHGARPLEPRVRPASCTRSRSSACAKTTSCSRRPSCSSPTASATA